MQCAVHTATVSTLHFNLLFSLRIFLPPAGAQEGDFSFSLRLVVSNQDFALFHVSFS